MRPILSLRDLAARLGTPIARMREIAEEVEEHYRHQFLRQGPSKVRQLRIPKLELRALQRRINVNILAPIALDSSVHGGVRGCSPRSNATAHLGQPCVINLDVREFFPRLRHYIVYRMFRHELGFGSDVARLLTRLTTFEAQLPQGSPTSTAIANIALNVPVDLPLSVCARSAGINYTRFVDDITLSGENPRPLINAVARLLSRRRLPLYRRKARTEKSKLQISPHSRPQTVTGLNVNSTTGPTIPRKYRDSIRAAIHQLRWIADRHERESAERSILGKIAYVRQFNPGAARRMKQQMQRGRISQLTTTLQSATG